MDQETPQAGPATGQKRKLKKYDHQIKGIILGNKSVGKTCIISQFFGGRFQEDSLATIGIEQKSKILEVQEKKVKF